MCDKNVTIGIVTHFYDSTNYGGVLQSYALVEVLHSFGASAHQICYRKVSVASKKRFLKAFHPVKLYRFVKGKIAGKNQKRVDAIAAKRAVPFSSFGHAYIPQTDRAYDRNTIKDTLRDTDVFITGSDQVWNTYWYDEVYRLDFVPQTKYKFSYAAGVSSGKLDREQQEVFRQTLSTYDAVSVREESAVEVLQPLSSEKVAWTLDPTLLLSREQWDTICAERKIDEEYIFCYFLGELSLSNKEIMRYAQAKNLKVVTMPYVAWSNKKDSDFGDYKIYDAAPQDFISLIKHAAYVFTDSFHAAVFSHIYQKDFFVFDRAGMQSMNDRVYSLLSLFDTQDRFCDTKGKARLAYIENLPPIDYNRPFPKFKEMKEKSIIFLRENLRKAEEKVNGNK